MPRSVSTDEKPEYASAMGSLSSLIEDTKMRVERTLVGEYAAFLELFADVVSVELLELAVRLNSEDVKVRFAGIKAHRELTVLAED